MNRTQLSTVIREEIKAVLEADGVQLKGASLPIQALKQIGVIKPEYLTVVLGKVSKGEKLPPIDDKYLADVFLKILATTDVNAMSQIFNTIRALSAKKDSNK